MYCNKCGKENNNANKFCISCGEKIEVLDQTHNKEKIGSSNLSIISLVFCIVQFISTFIFSNIEFLKFFSKVPWIIISLILAIISKCKYNDRLSLIMIIIDIILIVLYIILIIIFFFLFISLIESLLEGCAEIGTYYA